MYCCCVYWINKGPLSDIIQEMDHARLQDDDAKLQLKQPNNGHNGEKRTKFQNKSAVESCELPPKVCSVWKDN